MSNLTNEQREALRSAASVMGSIGGLRGGKARWANVSDTERSAWGRTLAEKKKEKRAQQAQELVDESSR